MKDPIESAPIPLPVDGRIPLPVDGRIPLPVDGRIPLEGGLPKAVKGGSVLTATWIVLISLSILTYYLAEETLAGGVLVAAVFAAVFVKLTLVIANFMELRHHGRSWLVPALGFISLVLVLLALTY